MRVLSRMWQMLLKGITEVQTATRPAAAAEMVLVRIAYVADLPTPDEAIRMLEQNGGSSPAASSSAAPRGAPASTDVRDRHRRPRVAPAAAPRGSAEARAQPMAQRRSRNPHRRCASPAFRSSSRSPARSATS